MTAISDAERAMMRCLTGEWMFSDRLVKEIKDRGPNPLVADMGIDEESIVGHLIWRTLNPMLQPQETSNRHADLLVAVAESVDVPYAEFPDAVERARAIERGVAEAARPLARVYNLTGDMLLGLGYPDFTSYAVRVADLEGVRRVAVLAAKLRSLGAAPAQVPALLLETDVDDPYTGEPFLWDGDANAIVFIGLEPGERGRHALLYGLGLE